MSRTAKNSQSSHIFTKLPQKPASPGFYDEVVEEVFTFTPKKELQKTKTLGSSKETAAGSEMQDLSIFSSIKQGVAEKVSELYDELRSSQSGLMSMVRMCRSAPIVSMSMLNQKNKKFKTFQTMSSQTEAKKMRASRQITLPGPASPTKEVKMFRTLISVNHDAHHPKEMLERFFSLTEIEDEVYVVALIYLQSALDSNPGLGAEHLHRLLVGCLLLAHKYLVDGQYWEFEDFGFVSGVEAGHLEKIEKYILKKILRYDLYVGNGEYERVLSSLFMSEAF